MVNRRTRWPLTAVCYDPITNRFIRREYAPSVRRAHALAALRRINDRKAMR